MPLGASGLTDPSKDGDELGSGLNKWTGQDAYAYALGFYEGDCAPIGGLSIPLGSTQQAWTQLGGHILDGGSEEGLFNGNIAHMITDLYFPTGTQPAESNFNAYAYKYDQLNRVKEARSYKKQAFLGWQRPGTDLGKWDATFAYDKNGNLESLQRRMADQQISPNGSVLMDNFTYNYDLSSGEKTDNKLLHVDDPVLFNVYDNDLDDQNPNNYLYDEIGNMLVDAKEQIGYIDWDLYNKISHVERDAAGVTNGRPDLYFWYDAMGNRIRKQVSQPISNGDPVLTDSWGTCPERAEGSAIRKAIRWPSTNKSAMAIRSLLT